MIRSEPIFWDLRSNFVCTLYLLKEKERRGKGASDGKTKGVRLVREGEVW
jgi:hypothetical protein